MKLPEGQSDLLHPDEKCRVCGKPLYSTDHDNYEVTYHCSSPEARFWDYERGTQEQEVSKRHWEQSREEVCLRRKDD
jgi:hypothetical protein